jgi:NAD+ diphosphatase
MLQTPTSFTPLLTAQPDADPLTLVLYGDQLLLRAADLALPAAAELAGLALAPPHPLGLWNGRYYQVAGLADTDALPAHLSLHGIRALFGTVDEGLLALAGRASQIVEWARTHRYCGVCATPMALVPGERCYRCPACGMAAYPRISPAMMVLIRKGDAVLLAWHARSPTPRYTPLAGFLEAGESVEEAVHREVMEEVGLRVHNLRYFDSQSWPFPHSLMLAYTADYLDGEIVVDQQEIAEARWFGPDDEWPEMLSSISVASALMAAHRPVAGRRPETVP